MSKQSFTQTRRTFLKGAACVSALTVSGVAGLSSLAIADGKMTTSLTGGTEVIDLINHTASPVKFGSQSAVSIAPGEQLSVVVAALSGSQSGSANNKNVFITDVLANDQLAIRSDYPEFNGTYPVTKFTRRAA